MDLDDLLAVKELRDGAGRRGLGVSWTQGKFTVILIDPRTYDYLGTTGRYGRTDNAIALVRTAIVDRVGQRPQARAG